jgi:uncharacterized protein (DUF58 family)
MPNYTSYLEFAAKEDTLLCGLMAAVFSGVPVLTPKFRQARICREGWYLLLLLGSVGAWAILREANLLLIVVGLLLGALVLNWRLAVVTLRRLEIRRRAASGLHAGGWSSVELELRNRRRRLGSWMVVLKDRIVRDAPVGGAQLPQPEVLFPYIPARQSQRQTVRISLPDRGRYRLGPIQLSTRFPFGLFRCAVRLEACETIVVYPRLGRLTPAWRRGYREAHQGQRGIQRPTRAVGDFFAVRQWQSGDSVRWVHWRGTARHGQLMVRQFEQPGERNTAVLLDLWQPADPGPEHARHVELAVSFAATVVADMCRLQRSRLLLAIAGPEPVCLSGVASPSLMKEAMERLAVVQATPEDWRDRLIAELTGRIGAGEEVILVSTRDARWADGTSLNTLRETVGSPVSTARWQEIRPGQQDFAELFLIS